MKDLIRQKKSYGRGSIWYVDLGNSKVGSEQVGMRPALIVSNELNNKYSPNVNVVVATTNLRGKSRLPVHVRAELSRESEFMCEQVITVSKERLVEHVGRLSNSKMEEVGEALMLQLGLS